MVGKQGEDYYVTDLGSKHGTWLNDKKIRSRQPAQVMPGDLLQFGSPNSLQLTFKVKMCHNTVFDQLAAVAPETSLPSGASASTAVPQPA